MIVDFLLLLIVPFSIIGGVAIARGLAMVWEKIR
jgi:hypothetical protein